MLICQICNKECKNNIGLSSHIRSHDIPSGGYYDKYLKKENEGICLECGKETKFINIQKGYRHYCSLKCSSNSNDIKIKKEKTCLKRYGFLSPLENTEIKEKIKNTNIKRYGVDNPNQNKEIIEKRKRTINCKINNNINYKKDINLKRSTTNLKKYGVDNPSKSYIIRESISDSHLKRSTNNIFNIIKLLNLKFDDLKYLGSKVIHNWKCLKCDFKFRHRFNDIQQGYNCLKCNPRNKSNGEKELSEFIKSIESSEIIENSRGIIPPYELDIFIPDKNIAIEFNGLYWHSEEHGKDKNYHLNKTELCEKKNIQLIHIFEDEWENNNVKIKELLTKILLEDYDLLDNNNFIMDRRFSKNLDYYTNKGYKIDIQSPKLYLNYYNYKIYDCGYYKLEV